MISHFGASDCWAVQYCGLWPEEKKNAMADLLFSTKVNADGKPLGIGLSLWRFNIGAGSADQGKESRISDIYRRTECFLNADGSIDTSKQKGQRWFLRAAKERGVNQFLAFSNSPPVYLTENGLATNIDRPRDGNINLPEKNYEKWAEFLSDFISGIAVQDGIRINYLSPFNEPEWNWDGTSQEGTPASVSNIASMVRLLDEKFSEKKLDTQIIVSESGHFKYMLESGTDHPHCDNEIAALFSPESRYFIGNLKHVPKLMAGHSYWTTSPVNVMQQTRKKLRSALDKYSLGFWQSEVCIMGNDREIGGGGGRDLGMKTALYVARLIHNDLCLANANAWHWWLAVSPYNYKDGLIYITAGENLLDGSFTDSKLLWTMGHFSRFIRPGAVRVAVNSEADVNDATGLMLSAYVHDKNRTLTLVAINYDGSEKNVSIKMNGFDATVFEPFVTSEESGHDLKPLSKVRVGDTFSIPARSVVTFVGKGK